MLSTDNPSQLNLLNQYIDLATTDYYKGDNQNFRDLKLSQGYYKKQLNFTSSVLGIKAIKNVIEEQASKTTSAKFYVNLQYLSNALPNLGLYQQIAAAGNTVYLFGLPDCDLPPLNGVIIVPLPGRPNQPDLSRNVFTILYRPDTISMALVTRESGQPNYIEAFNDLLYRNFEGFWTYDSGVISRLVASLDNFIGNNPIR